MAIANFTYIVEGEKYWMDNYEEGELITFPAPPQKEGFIFAGWYKDSDCLIQWNEETDTYSKPENLQTVKLINKKKGDTNTIQEKLIERLKEDNKNLQVALQDIQTGNNLLGINYAISLIHEDLNDSDFIDEGNFDEILTEMTKQLSISNSKAQSSIHNNRSSSNTNNQLRSSFEKLISEIALNPNTKSILSNILKQVSFSDEEIYQLIGKKGGTISLPK
jgi:hypothetical protein